VTITTHSASERECSSPNTPNSQFPTDSTHIPPPSPHTYDQNELVSLTSTCRPRTVRANEL
jgi:hypothetical protein